MNSTHRKNLLLTGRPGVGKTTVITRLADHFGDREVAGFYTEEIRGKKQRHGFRAVSFFGHEVLLAHVDFDTATRVGRYGVDVKAFECFALPELGRPCEFVLVDEIGKMECFSEGFVKTVGDLLDSPTPVVATVAAKGTGFIAEVKTRADVELMEVTRTNRDHLPKRASRWLARCGPA